MTHRAHFTHAARDGTAWPGATHGVIMRRYVMHAVRTTLGVTAGGPQHAGLSPGATMELGVCTMWRVGQ